MKPFFSYRMLVLAVLACTVALPASPARAQTGEDALRFSQRFPAVGARMVGLGGAGIAGVGDYAALYTNPAGLAYLQRSQLSGALSAVSTTDETRFFTPALGPSLADRDIRETELGNLAYVYRAPTVRGSFVVAAAYNQVASFDRHLYFDADNASSSITDFFLPFDNVGGGVDYYYDIDQDDLGYFPVFGDRISELAYDAGAIEFLFERVDASNPTPRQDLFWQAVAPGTTVQQQGEVLESGRMRELNFGGALEAAQGVMVGLSANLVFGTYRFDATLNETDVYDQNTADDYSVVDVVDDREYLGFRSLRFGQGFESDLTGFNLRAGVSLTPARNVRLGFSVETPTFYSLSETYYRELETFFDEGGSLSGGQDFEYEYEVTTPWRLGAGLSYDAGSLLVSGDVEYVDWSQLELDASDADYSAANAEIREVLEPVLNLRGGVEYRLGSLALRGGAAWQPDPRNYEIQLGDGGETDRSRLYYSLGLGYQFSPQFGIDLGWMQSRFDDVYVPYDDPDIEVPFVEESVVRNRFVVGARISF